MQLKMSQSHTQRTQIGRSSKRNPGNQMNVFRNSGAQGDKSVDPFEICDEQEGEQSFPHQDLEGRMWAKSGITQLKKGALKHSTLPPSLRLHVSKVSRKPPSHTMSKARGP